MKPLNEVEVLLVEAFLKAVAEVGLYWLLLNKNSP
jgi:hypothetical protein